MCPFPSVSIFGFDAVRSLDVESCNSGLVVAAVPCCGFARRMKCSLKPHKPVTVAADSYAWTGILLATACNAIDRHNTWVVSSNSAYRQLSTLLNGGVQQGWSPSDPAPWP